MKIDNLQPGRKIYILSKHDKVLENRYWGILGEYVGYMGIRFGNKTYAASVSGHHTYFCDEDDYIILANHDDTRPCYFGKDLTQCDLIEF